MKEKLIFIGEKKMKNPITNNPKPKKFHFPTLPILNIFSQNFQRLVLGLIELIDARGIGVAQPIWL